MAIMNEFIIYLFRTKKFSKLQQINGHFIDVGEPFLICDFQTFIPKDLKQIKFLDIEYNLFQNPNIDKIPEFFYRNNVEEIEFEDLENIK